MIFLVDAEGFSENLCIKDLEKLLEGVGAPWEEVEPKANDGASRAVSRARPTLKVGKKP